MVRPVGGWWLSGAPLVGAEGAAGSSIVSVARAAPSSRMLPRPDSSDAADGTLRHLRDRMEQGVCHLVVRRYLAFPGIAAFRIPGVSELLTLA
jgi:hypothetical protein